MAIMQSTNEQHIWISALLNHTAVNAMMIDRERNSQSMFNLIDRIADSMGLPKGNRSTGFYPVYNPQDTSSWPELLGWVITIGQMTEVT